MTPREALHMLFADEAARARSESRFAKTHKHRVYRVSDGEVLARCPTAEKAAELCDVLGEGTRLE